MEKSAVTDGPWDKAFLNAIEEACMGAIERAFGGVSDEKIRQALAQGFSAGVEWCFSEQFDGDIAKAVLAIGVGLEDAATGPLRKAR